MKKYIVSILSVVLFALQLPAQTIVNRAGPANTVQDARLAVRQNFLLPRYNDTTQANTDLGLDSCGAQFYSRVNNTVWYRQCFPKMWVKMMSTANGGAGSCGLSAGGLVTWSGIPLTYDVTSASYCINDNGYVYAGGNITLDAPHASLDRFDVLALDNTGNLVKITGTPNASPQVPTVDPGTQLYLTAILVTGGGSGAGSQTILWDENTGSPEYIASATGSLTTDFSNTVNPYHAMVSGDISGTTGGHIQFDGQTHSLIGISAIKFFIELKPGFLSGQPLMDAVLINSSGASQPVSLSPQYGFNSSVIGTYQNITIPVSAFGVVSDITGIAFKFNQAFAQQGFYIDYITLQGGIGNPGYGGNFVTHTFKRSDSVFYSVNGLDYFSHLDGNFATTDLTANGNRLHNFNNKNLTINYLDTISFIGYPEHDTTIIFNGGVTPHIDDSYTTISIGYHPLLMPVSDVTIFLSDGSTVTGSYDFNDTDSIFIYYGGLLSFDIDSLSFIAAAKSVNFIADVEFDNNGADASNIAFFDGDKKLKKGFLNVPVYTAGDGVLLEGSNLRLNYLSSGAGTRFVWNPSTWSFRAGRAFGSEWDDVNTGFYSVSFGSLNTASGDFSTVINGQNNISSGSYSLSIGNQNRSSGLSSLSFGFNNRNEQEYSVGFGISLVNKFKSCFVIGVQNDTTDASHRLFQIGNGGGLTGSTARGNAVTVLLNGYTGIGNTTNTLDPHDRLVIDGNFSIDSLGGKIKIATGSNSSIGTVTLVAGTVTVNTTTVTSSSKIFVVVNTPSGTQGFLSVPSASIVNSTSFVINSTSNTETSTVNYWIIN